MVDEAQILAVKKRAVPKLLARPGVHSVGIGIKSVGGVTTGELAIVVFVVEKKAPGALSPLEMIPTEIEGVKTDVWEVPMAIAHQAAPTPDTDKERPLLGGTQIATPSCTATLGCFVTIDGRPNQVFGLTNCHVPAAGKGIATNAKVETSVGPSGSPTQITISTTSGSTITPVGSVMAVDIRMANETAYNFLVQTSKSLNTPTDVAAELVSRINLAGTAAFHASSTGGAITLTTTAAVSSIDARFFSLGSDYQQTALQAEIGVGQITFTGAASSSNYGIFACATQGGYNIPTRGTFIPVLKGQELSSIAEAVALQMSDTGVPATSSGNVVLLAGMDHIECYVVSEVRVGQSDAQYASECCDWCPDTIGSFVAADFQLDASVIQLMGGLKYRAEIKDFGPITGSRVLTTQDVTNQIGVRKRGKTTLGTLGNLVSISNDGICADQIDSTDASKGYFGLRCYIDAMVVRGDVGVDISDHGDSGAVWVDGLTVIGLNFGGSRKDKDDPSKPPQPGYAFATLIKPILDRFQMHLVTATESGKDLEVPEASAAKALSVDNGQRSALAASATSPWRRQVDAFENDLKATPKGKVRLELFRRHLSEAVKLVNQNRRVGAAWQRNGGPILLKAVLQVAQDPVLPFPTRIMGKPLDKCLEAIFGAFRNNASPNFVSDLDRFAPAVTGLGGKTYSQLIEQLRGPSGTESAAVLSTPSE